MPRRAAKTRSVRAHPRLAKSVRAILFAYLVFAGFILRYHPAQPGLDPSWGVALNLFHVQGLIHGVDIGFTYGPLSYLILPMPMGSNLEQGIAFQFALWLLYASIIAWICFAMKTAPWRLFVLAVCIYAAQPLFDNFGYAGPDFFLVFLAILLLACDSSKWALFFGAAVVLSVLVGFIKASSGISGLSTLGLYAAATALFHRKRSAIMAAMLAVGAPLLFCAMYLLYSPSASALVRYVRSGLEQSAGYSSAMSQEGDTRAVATALVLLACYAILAGVLLWQKQPAFCLAFACLGPVFLEFKHAFVREAGHVEIFFVFLPLTIGAILLRVEFPRTSKKWIATLIPLTLLAFCWLYREGGAFSWTSLTWNRWGLRHLETTEALFHFTHMKERLTAESNAMLTADRLPAELLARLDHAPVTIFPWESAYAAANPITYRPFPVFQTYTAHTPYLDSWNASFLKVSTHAPQFVLFEWQAIDGRHPLLDVPATALELVRNYQLDSAYGTRLLLRRRAAPLPGETRHVLTRELRFGEPLPIPSGNHPLIARVHLKFNTLGKFRDLTFRIPEIRANLSSDGSRFVSARIPPLAAEDGIPLNFLPVNTADLQGLLTDNRLEERMTALVLGGQGEQFFQTPMRVDIEELTGITLQFREAPALDLKGKGNLGVADAARIEVLNRTGVAAIGPNEIIDLDDTQGFLYVQGWAIDRLASQAAGSVWIELDGRLYPATYGLPRADIAALFRNEGNYPASGFEWMYPSWKLGASVHELTMKAITRDGQSYYEGAQRLRFRVAR